MAVTPGNIVAIARGYVGTPFRHQGRIPGLALDCAGVVVCVAKELGLEGEFTEVPYGKHPHGGTLQRLCDAHMDRVSLYGAGDVLLMAWEFEPQHLAIVSDIGIIHSYAKAKKVVEHRLDRSTMDLAHPGGYRFRGMFVEPEPPNRPTPRPSREHGDWGNLLLMAVLRDARGSPAWPS